MPCGDFNMNIKIALLAASAVLGLTLSASAQNYGPQQRGTDPNAYYSQSDRNGYYDRSGTYRRFQGYQRDDYRGNNQTSGNYYRQGDYEQNCHRGNAAAGTIFGALAGGLIGSAASHGNGGAVVGGAILGGLLGNTVSKDIDCDDQPYAFRVYSDGLNGDVGRRYDWSHGQARGTFQPTREYRRSGTICRDFTETSYRGNTQVTRSGTACRAQDGNWRFD
jgi:surface antigen